MGSERDSESYLVSTSPFGAVHTFEKLLADLFLFLSLAEDFFCYNNNVCIDIYLFIYLAPVLVLFLISLLIIIVSFFVEKANRRFFINR